MKLERDLDAYEKAENIWVEEDGDKEFLLETTFFVTFSELPATI